MIGIVSRRRAALLGAFAVLGALVAPAPALAAPGQAPAFASFAEATILPGAKMITGDAVCTANFVYANEESVFLGYAAHCAGLGEATDVDGCATPTRPLGTPVTVVGTDGAEIVGALAYSSWVAMQDDGLSDSPLCELNDLALVAIDPDDVPDVNPSVPVFGGPTGLDDGAVARGDRVYSYQPNVLSDGAKQGIVVRDLADGLAHLVVTEPLGVAGDSGSGYLDAGGRAFGVLSAALIDDDGDPTANRVTALGAALAYARESGRLGPVRLVPGTEPFSTRGVPMTPLPALQDGGTPPGGTPVRP